MWEGVRVGEWKCVRVRGRRKKCLIRADGR